MVIAFASAYPLSVLFQVRNLTLAEEGEVELTARVEIRTQPGDTTKKVADLVVAVFANASIPSRATQGEQVPRLYKEKFKTMKATKEKVEVRP